MKTDPRRILNSKKLGLILVPIFVAYPLFVSLEFAFDPVHAPIAEADNSQYAKDWPAGWGVVEANSFFKTESADWSRFFASVQIVGISSVLILIISLLLIARSKNLSALFFWIIGLISIFMAIFVSTPVWKVIPSSFILFPFRFLSLLPISLAFLTGFILSSLNKKAKYLAAIMLVAVASYSTSFYFSPSQYFSERDDSFYSTNQATTTASNEYMPKWVKQRPLEMAKSKLEVVSGVASVNIISYKSANITSQVSASENSSVALNVIYFPGWSAYIDGVKTDINYNNQHGVMVVHVPKGQHLLAFRFRETAPRLIADLISLLAFIGLIFIAIKEKRNAKKT